jgi:hypothetical protein
MDRHLPKPISALIVVRNFVAAARFHGSRARRSYDRRARNSGVRFFTAYAPTLLDIPERRASDIVVLDYYAFVSETRKPRIKVKTVSACSGSTGDASEIQPDSEYVLFSLPMRTA